MLSIFWSCGTSIFSSLWNLHIVLPSECTNVCFHRCRRVPFSPPPLPAFIVCRHFDDGHCDRCEVIVHCSFVLHFSDNQRCWASFDHVDFILQYVNMVHHTDRFLDIKKLLHPWDKFHLAMGYDSFNVLLDSVC